MIESVFGVSLLSQFVYEFVFGVSLFLFLFLESVCLAKERMNDVFCLMIAFYVLIL